MRRLTFLILMLLFICSAAPLASRANTESAASLNYHPYNELGIKVMTRGNAFNVAELLADPSVRIFILQVPFEQFDLSCCPDIINWVRQGHSLWFYDSRYAPYFGMKAYALSGQQFKGRDESGELGEHKYSGRAAGVLCLSKQNVMSGVGQCTVFLPLVGQDNYSAVALGGDTLPLLQFASDSPALAAMRRDGKGLVVFKPLLWPESLSGKRFQYNLLEYSAGFGVPGIGGEGRIGEFIGPEADYIQTNFKAEAMIKAPQENITEAGGGYVYAKSVKDNQVSAEAVAASQVEKNKSGATDRHNTSSEGRWSDKFSEGSRLNDEADTKLESKILTESAQAEPVPSVDTPNLEMAEGSNFDIVVLRGGDTFIGRCHNREIMLETTSESVKAAPADFKSILFSTDSWSLDKCEMEDGRHLSGYMLTNEFYFSNEVGDRTFKKEAIKNIRFRVPAEQIKH
ncbi:MAG: hypothetical protein ACI376_03930 [Candidatus Bruticola sp.]